MRALMFVTLTSLALLLSACGQKGPLFLPPEPEVAVQPADGTSPAPVSNSAEDDADAEQNANLNQSN